MIRLSWTSVFAALIACSSLTTSTVAFQPAAFLQGRHPQILRNNNEGHQQLLSSTALWMARQQQRGRGRRGPPVVQKGPPMNEEIPDGQLRVVTPNPKGKDEPLGIMSTAEAMTKAKEMGGLDLILVNANSDPPVCKIVDYSKYRYMQEKKAKEVKKNSKATEIKEVKMSYKIDVHDYDVRKRNAAKFLNQGNRVKCTVMFRGREVQHDKLGYELLEKLAVDLDTICTKEGKPKREGRNLGLILSPRPEVLKAVNEKRRANEKAKKKNKKAAFDEKQAAKAAVVQQEEVNGVNNKKEEDDGEEEEDLDVESSLDDLLGGDDYMDDLFK